MTSVLRGIVKAFFQVTRVGSFFVGPTPQQLKAPVWPLRRRARLIRRKLYYTVYTQGTVPPSIVTSVP
jgi:hypothetical protein